MHYRASYVVGAIALLVSLALVEDAALRAQDAAAAQSAATLLAAARQAMGGQAAFTALTSLEVFGTVVQTAQAGRTINVDGQTVSAIVGGRANLNLDVKVALPDRYVRINRFAPNEGSAMYVEEFRGFNGSDLIRDTSAQWGGVTDSKIMPSPKLPATRLQYLLDAKHSFACLLLPLLANAYDAYPFDFSAGDTERLQSGPASVVNVEGADGLRWKLYLDNSTHLPVLMTGRMKPIIGPLLIEYYMPEEDWHMTITDYKVANGFKWPRKLTSQFGDDLLEQIEYTRFSINPKFGDRTFTPSDGR